MKNKELSIILIILIVSSFVYFSLSKEGGLTGWFVELTGLFVKSEQVNGIEVKFYDEANKKECIALLETVPAQYSEGLKVIKVFPPDETRAGHYYESYVLEVYGCNFHSLNHELAHHWQHLQGESSADITHHGGLYNDYERQVFEALWAANGNSIPSFG